MSEKYLKRLHGNAALTLKQRQEVRRLFLEDHIPVAQIARRFSVHETTIRRWIPRESPKDLSTRPRHPRAVITPEYRKAVVEARRAQPELGPIRLADLLRPHFPQAKRGTISTILRQEGISRRAPRRNRERKPIPVGRHRVQMDVQQLPAVEGGRGFEYKITAIHLKTRFKYSEIHPDHRTTTVAGVLRRALDRLPPFTLS